STRPSSRPALASSWSSRPRRTADAGPAKPDRPDRADGDQRLLEGLRHRPREPAIEVRTRLEVRLVVPLGELAAQDVGAVQVAVRKRSPSGERGSTPIAS